MEKNTDQSGRIRDLEAKVKELQAENDRLRRRQATTTTTSSIDDTQSTPRTQQQAIEQLSSDHIERYSRQLLLSNGFGVSGQIKLLNASVLVVGAGGIGSTVLLYLAAAGVGHIGIVDFDAVDISNLHRQVIHKSADVGKNKAESAREAIYALNPTIVVETIQLPLTHDNALDLISQYSCVVDACDNPQTRYVVNDACVLAKVPLVSGSAVGTEGQLTVYNYKGGPCYRCLYPRPNQTEGSKSCSDNGVLGPVPGLVGVLQAVEAIKVLTDTG
jgi:adenylyltransferase and sulfurtransferase